MPEPDFFDRLVSRARGAPAADPGWVRPRLPQLFERTGLEIQEVEVDAAPVPAPAPAAPAVAAVTQRVQAAAPEESRPIAVPVPAPVVPVEPVTTPAATAPVAAPAPPVSSPASPAVLRVERLVERAESRHREPGEATGALTTVPKSVEAGVPLAARRVPAVPFDARRAPAAEPARAAPPEQVIKVSIGRLEVTAAAPAQERPQRRAAGRPAPRVSLDRHLGREEAP
ncbi:hypothetical protein AB0F81_42320 [Actinoplanes sp. NPDC024001]|uniref:hypothetical protein n=1 Tax=Actinoplanes sp. NPDC024001 TaxID=3154598 RepID=UPI0033E9E57E